jgi:uncharacterized protein (DUF1499 family)
MWPKLVGGILGVILIPLILILGGILLNRPTLFEAPGLMKRMSIYLRYNVAETTASPILPELRIRRYSATPEAMKEAVERTLPRMARWKVVKAEPEIGVYHAEVTTALWRFKDDLSILITDQGGEVEVYLHSSSRVGRGDLGANRRHILEFYEALDEQLKANGTD